MCNTQKAAFLFLRTFQAPFSIIKFVQKRGDLGWGCITALRAAAAGHPRHSSQKGASVLAQFPYKHTAVNVRQAHRSHAMPLNI